MQTHPAKSVEITIEAALQRRLCDAISEAGITGWTLLPVLGGSGRSGRWRRDGEVSRASGMVVVVCVVREELLNKLLEAAFSVVERHIGIVTITDVEVLRAERF